MTSGNIAWAFSLDLYHELQIAESALAAEINCAYRGLVRIHHPDKGGSAEKIKAIDAARTVLLDVTLKREYDRLQKKRTQAQWQHDPLQLEEPMDPSQLEQIVTGLLRFLHPPKRADSDCRVIAGRHRQALRGLTLLPSLASFFEPCMQGFTRLILDRGASSFHSLFKEQSMCGYDVVNGRCLDYGNFAYKSWLYACSLSSASCHAMLLACHTQFPTLHPQYKDTFDALNNQGDIVESLYGLCRGDDFMNLRAGHRNASWRQAHTDASACFAAFDYLECLLHGRTSKRGVYVPKVNLPFDVEDKSIVLGTIAFALAEQIAKQASTLVLQAIQTC